MSITPSVLDHDPNAVLDYVWSWSDWLETGDSITSATASVTDASNSLTIDSTTNTSTTVTVWLSGGTVGTQPTATVHVTTVDGREDDRTLTLNVRER